MISHHTLPTRCLSELSSRTSHCCHHKIPATRFACLTMHKIAQARVPLIFGSLIPSKQVCTHSASHWYAPLLHYRVGIFSLKLALQNLNTLLVIAASRCKTACSVLCSLKSLKSELSVHLSSEHLRGTQLSENKGLSTQAASAAECTNHRGAITGLRQEKKHSCRRSANMLPDAWLA